MTDLPPDVIIYLDCPHCGHLFMTTENTLACAIYRHAVLKSNMEQINPHSSEEECKNFIDNDLIYGCGKPFRVIKKDNNYEAIICDYI